MRIYVRGIPAVLLMLAGATAVRGGVTTTPLGEPSGAAKSTTSSPMATTESAVTPERAQALAASGQYREALRVLLRLLDMKGAAASPDRAGLQLLRGECQLQVHENASAITSLQAAAKEAATNGNADEAAHAEALIVLYQKSPRDQYVPVTGAVHKPLNILDAAQRTAAYEAFFTDTLALYQQKLRAASSGVTIAPLLEVAKTFVGARAVEQVATGTTKQSDDFAKQASQTASKLIGSTLSAFDTKISRISTAAERMIRDNNGNIYATMHHAGLSADDATQLRDIITAAQKIPEAVDQFNQAFAMPELFNRLSTRAETLRDRANTVLKRDYRLQ